MEPKPMRLLIMDLNYKDYLVTCHYIHQISTQKYQTYWCSDYHQVMDSMLNSLYDAYVIDYHLHGKKSTDHLVEAMIEECEAPVVLLTNPVRASLKREAYHLKLIKSELNSEKLENGIRYALERTLTSRKSNMALELVD